MIVVPTSLFHLDVNDCVLIRKGSSKSATPPSQTASGSSPSRSPGRKQKNGGTSPRFKRDTFYNLPGRISVDVLVLFRESATKDEFFIALTETEVASLTPEQQSTFKGSRRVLADKEIERMGQSIGINSDTGGFTRNPLLWTNMCSLDGTFYLSRQSVLIIDATRGGPPSSFLLNEAELTELLRLNKRADDPTDRSETFLHAAVSLLADKHARETQETEVYRRLHYRTFPAPNELMVYGLLKKRNKNLGWKERFVAVSPGRMFYVEKASSSSLNSTAPVATLSSSSLPSASTAEVTEREKGTNPKVIPLLPGRTWCRAAPDASSGPLFTQPKYDSERIFELIVSSEEQHVGIGEKPSIRSSSDTSVTKYIWACESREERDRWVHLIQVASALHKPEPDETASTSLSAVRGRVAKMDGADALVQYLSTLAGKDVNVSVDVVQNLLNRARGEMDASLEQTAKDLQRDACLVNGESVFPCGLSSCLGTLLKHMKQILSSAGVEDGASITAQQQAVLLDFARLVVLATNRTQSGGLAFEAINLVLMPPGGTVILVPISDKIPSPIVFQVEKPGPQPTTSPGPAFVPVPTAQSLESGGGGTATSASTEETPSKTNKRRFHGRTPSDPSLFFRFLSSSGLDKASVSAPAVATGTPSSSSAAPSPAVGPMAASPGPSAVPALPAAPAFSSSAATAVLPAAPAFSSASAVPTSPKNSSSSGLMMRSLSMRGKKTVESEGLSTFETVQYDHNIRLRVRVSAEMEFALLDGNDVHRRLALIKACYSRQFCLVEDRSFATDQGSITLRISQVEPGGAPPSETSHAHDEEVQPAVNEEEDDAQDAEDATVIEEEGEEFGYDVL